MRVAAKYAYLDAALTGVVMDRRNTHTSKLVTFCCAVIAVTFHLRSAHYEVHALTQF